MTCPLVGVLCSSTTIDLPLLIFPKSEAGIAALGAPKAFEAGRANAERLFDVPATPQPEGLGGFWPGALLALVMV